MLEFRSIIYLRRAEKVSTPLMVFRGLLGIYLWCGKSCLEVLPICYNNFFHGIRDIFRLNTLTAIVGDYSLKLIRKRRVSTQLFFDNLISGAELKIFSKSLGGFRGRLRYLSLSKNLVF